jgi:cation:H+ antiporter
MLFTWSLVFIVALLLMIKSADFLTEAALKLSSDLKISAFITGLIVVSLGTSLPELSFGIAAATGGWGELAAALAIGSTIAGILLVVGVSVISAKALAVRKQLIDLDASLFAICFVLFYFIARDGRINPLEGIVLIAAFLVYASYVIGENKGDTITADELITPELLNTREGTKIVEVLPTRLERGKAKEKMSGFTLKIFFILTIGLLGLVIGANLALASLVNISYLFQVQGTILAMTMLAVGTALPELFVAVSAASKKINGLALGNVFGSSIINLLLVLGISPFFGLVHLDGITLSVGLPFLLASAVLLLVSGISRRIHRWEGIMYLLLYFVFIVQVFGLF